MGTKKREVRNVMQSDCTAIVTDNWNEVKEMRWIINGWNEEQFNEIKGCEWRVIAFDQANNCYFIHFSSNIRWLPAEAVEILPESPKLSAKITTQLFTYKVMEHV